jgi:hypothetical protein
MENRFLLLFILLFTLFSCSNTDYQKIIINNSNKTISLLSPDFVIDSVSIQKFGKTEYSCSLDNKYLGTNKIIMTKDNKGYNVYTNNLKSFNCNDNNLSLTIIIRKRGATTKVTENIAMNLETNSNIQVKDYKFYPCSKKIDTLETDRSFK